MMWKLLHKLFGWDYIQWSNSSDQGVARVHTDQNARTYYWRYKSMKLVDEIKDTKQVFWLTCPPSKYMRAEQGGSFMGMPIVEDSSLPPDAVRIVQPEHGGRPMTLRECMEAEQGGQEVGK
jgi:hypothetical protein